MHAGRMDQPTISTVVPESVNVVRERTDVVLTYSSERSGSSRLPYGVQHRRPPLSPAVASRVTSARESGPLPSACRQRVPRL